MKTHLQERIFQVVRKGGDEGEPFCRPRVAQGKAQRVEPEARETVSSSDLTVERTFAIVGVSDHRVIDVLEMTPNLVEPTCLGNDLDE